MFPKWIVLGLAPLLLAGGCATRSPELPANVGVHLTPGPGSIKIEIAGQPFTEYHFTNTPRPYFYPLLGPGEVPLTRRWPLEPSTNEEHDHPHHRSLWFAHGEVNGRDFWSEEKQFGKIVHDGFTELKSGRDSAVIRSRDSWVDATGKVVCTDDRVMRVYNRVDVRMFDFEVTIHASHGDVTFGDTKEGSMALRIAETMRLKQPKNQPGQGHIINSEGVKDAATWGKRADWVDYSGPVNGRLLGIAMFDHPANPRHPTTWHVRDYGLFAANPFGLHDFEKKPAHAGDFKIPAGQSATFRYRMILHAGDEQQAGIAAKYQEYLQSTGVNPKPLAAAKANPTTAK